jgi:tetratricopeptide (TPR) repeat protein
VCLVCAAALFAQKPAPKAATAAGPAPAPASATTPASPKNPQNASAVAEKYSKEAVVLERIRARFRYENDGTGDEVDYIRVRIQGQSAIRGWGQLVFSYNSSTDKIHLDFLRVHKPDGRVVTAGPDAIHDLSSPVERVAPVYTAMRQLHVTVPDLGIGDTLEYQITTRTIHPLVPGQFFLEWNFPKKTITLNDTLDVNVPAGRQIKLKTSNGAAAPRIEKQGDRRIYHWHYVLTQRPDDSVDKNGKKKKKKKPAKFPDVAISTFDSWAQVGTWYAGLERPRAAVTDAVRAEAATLVKGQTTDLGKVRAIYRYVSENIRYVSLSFGLGQYQPHPAAEVIANQYGDCKDKATLFQSLLAAEGISSYPALINAEGHVDPGVPSPGQFDHLINVVQVDGKTYWGDTTPGVAPFGTLLSSLRDKWALVIPPAKTPALERTPQDPPSMPVQVFSTDGKINSLGGLAGNFSITATGDLAVVLRSSLDRLSQNNWQQMTKGLIHGLFSKNSKPGDGHFSDPGDLSKPMVFQATFTEPDMVDLTQQETSLALPNGGVDLNDIDRPDKGSTDPLKLGTIHDETLRWKIELPPQLTASLPVPVHLSRDYAQYDATYSLSGRTLVAVRHVVLRKSKLPPARYDDYKAFYSAVTADEQQTISLTNSAPGLGAIPKGMSADDIVQAAFNAERVGNYSEAVRLFSQVAKEHPDRRNIWGQLGYAELGARQYQKAVTGFQKQIAANAYAPYAYFYLGNTYQMLGRYDAAIRAYKKQIQINPLHKYAHENLGNVYLLQKKYALAESEFESATKLDPKNVQLYVGLGDAQLGLNKDAAALQSFQKVLARSPGPLVWNNIAYVLSEHRAHLDMALQLSENSIRATEAQLNGISLDTIGKAQAGQVSTITSYWDTMGWILFQQGRTKMAAEYIQAAWMMEDSATIGDHMGQIYEKEKHRSDATRAFVLALLCPNPPAGTRARLAALVGKKKVDAEIDSVRGGLAARRTVKLPNAHHLDGSAQFWILLSPGSKASRSKATAARVEDVKFISGDDALHGLGAALRKARFPYSFPPGEQTKLALRGVLSCKAAARSCSFVPFSDDETVRRTLASGSDQQ